MKPPARAILLFAASVLTLVGAESTEPLSGVKQELKQLQSDATAEKNGAVDPKLKPALPSLVIVTPDSNPTESTSAKRRKKEQELKNQKQLEKEKDWLLREYDKLEREEHPDRADEKAALPTRAIEPGDHDETLLQQLTDNDPKKGEQGSRPRYQMPGTQPVDPLAPFMKDWLANSPVRGPMFDTLLSPDVAQPAGRPASNFESRASTNVPVTTDLSSPVQNQVLRSGTPAAPNPFLVGLEVPSLREGASFPLPTSPVAEALVPADAAPRGNLFAPAPSTIEPDKRNPLAPPPSKLADDRKYFPQQKRF